MKAISTERAGSREGARRQDSTAQRHPLMARAVTGVVPAASTLRPHTHRRPPAGGRPRPASAAAAPRRVRADEGVTVSDAIDSLLRFMETSMMRLVDVFQRLDRDGLSSPFRVSLCAARTLNVTGQPRVTLSLQKEHF